MDPKRLITSWNRIYEGQDFYLDIDEKIKLRVVEGTFIDSNVQRTTAGDHQTGGNPASGNQQHSQLATDPPPSGGFGAENRLGTVTNPNQSHSILNGGNSPLAPADLQTTQYVPPYLLTCSMTEDGLGPVSWW
ncbi:hypothetical protein AYI68_g5222 [Smittium mucronatum]|uniref:RNA polymerase III subunit Rpc25 domain-containing protein n=1 Tax=Smittium mucronatum TaxID=133383 RepID=A0A1R0GV04_9FUNG|nr:hypothetical protein AYI68_g5222 [Smittium mucronatum]